MSSAEQTLQEQLGTSPSGSEQLPLPPQKKQKSYPPVPVFKPGEEPDQRKAREAALQSYAEAIQKKEEGK